MTAIQSDIRSAIQFATSFRHHRRRLFLPRSVMFRQCLLSRSFTVASRFGEKAFSTETDNDVSSVEVVNNKPPICTADELHYVSVDKSQWRLALWRYKPPPQVCKKSLINYSHINFFFIYAHLLQVF